MQVKNNIVKTNRHGTIVKLVTFVENFVIKFVSRMV